MTCRRWFVYLLHGKAGKSDNVQAKTEISTERLHTAPGLERIRPTSCVQPSTGGEAVKCPGHRKKWTGALCVTALAYGMLATRPGFLSRPGPHTLNARRSQ